MGDGSGRGRERKGKGGLAKGNGEPSRAGPPVDTAPPPREDVPVNTVDSGTACPIDDGSGEERRSESSRRRRRRPRHHRVVRGGVKASYVGPNVEALPVWGGLDAIAGSSLLVDCRTPAQWRADEYRPTAQVVCTRVELVLPVLESHSRLWKPRGDPAREAFGVVFVRFDRLRGTSRRSCSCIGTALTPSVFLISYGTKGAVGAGEIWSPNTRQQRPGRGGLCEDRDGKDHCGEQSAEVPCPRRYHAFVAISRIWSQVERELRLALES